MVQVQLAAEQKVADDRLRSIRSRWGGIERRTAARLAPEGAGEKQGVETVTHRLL